MALAEAVYAAAQKLPPTERYELSSQLRRAAVSVVSNIAEGHGRLHRAEFVHHLSIALGSVREVETHLLLSQRLRMFSDGDISSTVADAMTLGRMLAALIRRLRSTRPAASD
jgi:four helix bundle protein